MSEIHFVGKTRYEDLTETAFYDSSKGVNPRFWSKNGHFSNFFFLGNNARKIFFTIF